MQGVKVFGIGMAKTGTCSLNFAMKMLGFTSTHGFGGNNDLSVLAKTNYACDMPITTRYRQIDQMFPGSKFILVLREFESWKKSASSWMCDTAPEPFHSYRVEQFGYGTFQECPSEFTRRYVNHTIDVLKYFRSRPGDLLVMDICGGDGWEVLCPFVGKDIPGEPFPHRNRQVYE